MNIKGFIKVNRTLLAWDLYKDIPCKVLLFHLLLIANYIDDKDLKRGQCKISQRDLALTTGLTNKQVRLALEKLIKAQTIVLEVKHKISIITVCNYDNYQSEQAMTRHNDRHNMGHNTGQNFGHNIGKVSPIPPLKDNNNYLITEEDKTHVGVLKKNSDLSNSIGCPPTIDEVTMYVVSNKLAVVPNEFWTYYNDLGWRTKSNKPITDWKIIIKQWHERNNRNGQSSAPSNSKFEANEYAISLLADF